MHSYMTLNLNKGINSYLNSPPDCLVYSPAFQYLGVNLLHLQLCVHFTPDLLSSAPQRIRVRESERESEPLLQLKLEKVSSALSSPVYPLHSLQSNLSSTYLFPESCTSSSELEKQKKLHELTIT